MSLVAELKALTRSQRSAIWASYLGWTLDAFDFFLLVFLKTAIGKEFGVSDEQAWAVGLDCGGRIEVFVEPVSG